MSKNGSGSCDLGEGQRELRPGQDNHDHYELVQRQGHLVTQGDVPESEEVVQHSVTGMTAGDAAGG